MILRLICSLLLFIFAFSSLGEARQSKASHSKHLSAVKHKTKARLKKRRESLAPRKSKTRKAVTHRKRKFRTVTSSRKRHLRRTGSKKKQVRTALSRKPHSRPTTTKPQHRHKTVATRKKLPPILSVKKRRNHSPLPPPLLTYVSQLSYQNQENAKVGGLFKLYEENLLGQGQTIAVVEFSGTWQELKNAMNKKEGGLSNKTRERYKRNFLTPIGGPGLHPEERTKWSRSDSYHGSTVASVVLDLTPQGKVLPVSTYNCHQTNQSYDIANALFDLLRRKDVNIINLSSGHLEEKWDRLEGKNTVFYKYVFPQKYITALKAAAKAGKVIVYAAGNETLEVVKPVFHESIVSLHAQFMGYLVENLDSETLKSIVFAGAYEPDTKQISTYSNRPGKRVPKAQERFLFAPTNHLLSYKYKVAHGTSHSAPYICAAIANLASRPRVTPKMAVEALMETAEARPREKHIYGRGLIRADRALEWLESRGF